MAIANNIQILVDSNKRTVIKRTGIIDSDDDTVVNGTSMQLMNEYELSEKIYKNVS